MFTGVSGAPVKKLNIKSITLKLLLSTSKKFKNVIFILKFLFKVLDMTLNKMSDNYERRLNICD